MQTGDLFYTLQRGYEEWELLLTYKVLSWGRDATHWDPPEPMEFELLSATKEARPEVRHYWSGGIPIALTSSEEDEIYAWLSENIEYQDPYDG